MMLKRLLKKKEIKQILNFSDSCDPFTVLKPGATGIINYTFDNYGKTCILVSWDNSGSVLMLVEGVDKYEFW